MTRILLLTKNILAEQQFQLDLQHLNYEVLCSSDIYYELHDTPDLLKSFDCIIISETFSKIEREALVNKLDAEPAIVFCRVSNIEEVEKNVCGRYLLLGTDESMERTRDRLSESMEVKVRKTRMLLITKSKMRAYFSKNELKLLLILGENSNNFVDREKICEYIWSGRVNKSTLSQLSALVKRINEKCSNLNLTTNVIERSWKLGYKVNGKIWDYFN